MASEYQNTRWFGERQTDDFVKRENASFPFHGAHALEVGHIQVIAAKSPQVFGTPGEEACERQVLVRGAWVKKFASPGSAHPIPPRRAPLLSRPTPSKAFPCFIGRWCLLS